MNESAEAALVGRTIAGKFLIESLIGVGAMGAVYKARQLTLDKTIAVKVLHPDRARDEMYSALFHREAKAASRLDHPNSVRVVDFGQEPDGLLYIAMEYFAGRDLLRVLSDDWPLPAFRIADILSQALAAIAVAHDMGMVHRDLKPENILVQRGTDDEGAPRDIVKVCDFGIAKFTEPSEALSSGNGKRLTEGVVIGTPHYMSPEQGQGEVLDGRTDLYSMGIILYQTLTARVPFEGKTLVEVVVKHVRDEPVPPSKTVPWVDRRLEAICLKALRKKRSDRYQTAREMRAELRAVFADVASTPQLPRPASKSATTLPPPTSSGGPAQPVKPPLALESSPSKVTPPPISSTNQVHGTRKGARAALLGGVALAALLAGLLMIRTARVPTPFASPISRSPGLASAATALAAAPTSVRSDNLVVTSSPAPALALQPALAQQQALAQQPELAPKEASPSRDVSKSKTWQPWHKKDPARPAEPEPPRAVTAESPPTAAAPSPVAALPSPPTPAATAAAPPAPIAPQAVASPAPAARPFDPARGRVDWSVGATGGGPTSREVRRALARVSSAWSGCYQSALRAAGQRAEGTGALRITTDDDGNVVQARLSGFGLAGVGACIAASSNVHIDGADTGSAWADVKLTFRVESTE